MKMVDGHPRRDRLDMNSTAELAIRDAARAVEEAGAHPLLTDALNLLHQARGKVADWIEQDDDSDGRNYPHGRCEQCDCEVHPNQRICGECACEEDGL